jgi:hypothetical protein
MVCGYDAADPANAIALSANDSQISNPNGGCAMSAITMILCHGTHADFKGFDPSERNESGAFGSGFYFSNDIELEQEYSNGLDPVVAKVTLHNPYILDKSLPYDKCLAAARIFRPIEHARERLIGQGYDGVLLIQDAYVEVVAFYPRQIESYGRRPDLSIKDQRILQNSTPFFRFRCFLRCTRADLSR